MKGRGTGCLALRPEFDGLESRLLLSGNVTASVVAGTLYLTGDSSGNTVTVKNTAPGEFLITAGSDGTQINGGAGPATVTGVTGDISASMGAGDDTLIFQSNSIPHSVFVDMGPGANSTYFSGVEIAGGVTILNGPGSDSVDFSTVDVGGSVFVSNQGGSTWSGGAYDGYESVFHYTTGAISGSLSIFDGSGADACAANGMNVTGPVFVSAGAGAALTDLENGTASSSVTLIRGDGGALSGGWDGFAGAVNIRNFSLGNLTVFSGSGADFLGFDTSPAGSVFVQDGSGPAYTTATHSAFSGSFTLMTTGGGNLSGIYSDWTTYTVFYSGSSVDGDLSLTLGDGNDEFGLYNDIAGGVTINAGANALLGYFSDGSVAHATTLLRGEGGALGGAYAGFSSELVFQNETLAGSLTIINGSGNDGVIFTNGSVHGVMLVSNGYGGSYFRASGLTTLSGITVISSGGTALPDVYSDYNSYTLVTGAASIGGDLTVIAGAGNDYVGIDHSTVHGSLLASLGALGGALDVVNTSLIAGGVTFLRGDGGSLLAHAGDASSVTFNQSTVSWGVTVINGSGADALVLNSSVTIGWGLLVSDGYGGGYLNATGATLGGPVTFLRGDDGDTAEAPSYASWINFNPVEIGGPVFILNGNGEDHITFSNATLHAGLTILNGSGYQEVSYKLGTLSGAVFVTGYGSDATIILGDSSGATHITGGVTILTGDAGDAVQFGTVTVDGAVFVNTAGGNDIVSINDSSFGSSFDLMTGPAWTGTTDDDTLYVERSTGTPTGTTFTGAFRVNAGYGNDNAYFSRSGVAGCLITFTQGFTFDGGLGTNAIEYLLNNISYGPGASGAVTNATAS